MVAHRIGVDLRGVPASHAAADGGSAGSCLDSELSLLRVTIIGRSSPTSEVKSDGRSEPTNNLGQVAQT